MKRTFYIAGPIFGTGPGRNRPMFETMAAKAENQLMCKTILPHDIPPDMHEGPCPPGRRSDGAEHNEACYLRADIKFMLRDCVGIVMCPGWQQSWGARTEMDIAIKCGLQVYMSNPGNMDFGALIRMT